MPLTASQIQRLGKRLGQTEPPAAADLDLLDEFERSFEPALNHVVRTIRDQLGLNPTTRQKTRRSIVAKIRRQHTALSRMQDIAGCRLVVEDVVKQDEVVERLCQLEWEALEVDDRRSHPSHGYRAVHVIVTASSRPVEIQIRTAVQDLWAQISEKMADRYGLEVKYGGGPGRVQKVLPALAAPIAQLEEALLRVEQRQSYRSPQDEPDLELEALKTDIRQSHEDLRKVLNELLVTLSE